MEKLVERFLTYVKVNTRSDANSQTTPTTVGQVVLARMIEKYGGELELPKTEENDMNDTTKQGTQGSSGMNLKKFPTSSLTADKTA